MSPLPRSKESTTTMESETKEKNQKITTKLEDVNRILNYDSIEKPSLEKSPIRPKAFKMYSSAHDDHNLNEGFKTPLSAKMSACNSPLDGRLFSYASKRLDMSPFDNKPNESPFTCFAKNLRFSPMVQKPNLLFINSNTRGGKSPSPWKLPLDDEDFGLSPFKRKEFSAMKNRNYNQYDEEYPEESRGYSHEPRYLESNVQVSPKFRQSYVPQSHRNVTIPASALDNPFATYREKAKEDEEKAEHHRADPRHFPLRTPSPSKKTIKIHSNAFMSTADEPRQRKNSESFADHHHDHSEEETMTKKSYDEEDNESTASKKKICCNCKKSRCLKLYCDCFARGEVCTKDCNCVNCLNTENNTEERQNAMMGILDRNPNAFKPKVDRTESPAKAEVIDKGRVRHVKGCNCKKSGCQKKYCECFQAGVKCTELCKCENCKNCDSHMQYKRSQSFGMVMNSDSKCDHAHSDISYSGSKRIRRNDDEIEEEYDEEMEEAKRYNNPRKQLPGVKTFTTSMRDEFSKSKKKNDSSKINTPKSLMMKKEEEELEKSDKKQYHLHYRTPNGQDMKKSSYNEYTPSPGKISMYEGRTRGSVRNFSHLNPEEYEMSK